MIWKFDSALYIDELYRMDWINLHAALNPLNWNTPIMHNIETTDR